MFLAQVDPPSSSQNPNVLFSTILSTIDSCLTSSSSKTKTNKTQFTFCKYTLSNTKTRIIFGGHDDCKYSKWNWQLALPVKHKSVMGGSQNCAFQTVFNFGDSNSDTGQANAAWGQIPPPNGETFFGHPAGRASDGRLIIDFIADKLNLPYLSAYLDSFGAGFRHGVNFATGGASIRPGGYSPINLGFQIAQFVRFKACTIALYNEPSPNKTGNLSPLRSRFPPPREFSKALYIFDIGQNDLSYGFQHMAEEQVRNSIPDILSQFSDAVQLLYKEGARFFWVHSTGPLGCLPYTIIYNAKPGNVDQNGCVKNYNDMAQEFNRQLKDKVSLLRTQLPGSAFTYVDVYAAKDQLISTAKSQGFVHPKNFCCGSYYGYHVNCGKQVVVNGTVYGRSCKDPSRYISWDGIHYTEAANQCVANHILNGSLSHPPLAIEEACQHL